MLAFDLLFAENFDYFQRSERKKISSHWSIILCSFIQLTKL